jgi:hypothetical protein
MSTTTINAIVTQEEGEYKVYFNSTYTNMLGTINADCWYTGDYDTEFGGDLDAAKSYANRLVLAEPWALQIMSPWNRFSAGSHQGAWNAPIVHRATREHQGELLK